MVINADAWSSQLDAVLAIDHDRLRHLLVEAGRETDTPGVRREMANVFAGEVAAHLVAEEDVLTAGLQHDLPGSAARTADRLRQAAGRLAAAPGDQAALAVAADALERHVSVHEADVLPSVREQAPTKQLAVLATRFAQVREAAPRRLPSDDPRT